MGFWLYKCNARRQPYQRAWGDWSDFFATRHARQWGSTRWVPELAKAQAGDTVIAYQTDRNELVGIARVKRWRRRGTARDLILEPVRVVGVRVRPLKARAPRIQRISALQPGPIQTLYAISRADAVALLKAAGAEFRPDPGATQEEAERALRGAGFGTPEENRRVERAAIRHVLGRLRASGWSVRDVSKEARGYDLLCQRGSQRLHVEVKGARGGRQQFLITEREKGTWFTDRWFALAFVANALSRAARVIFFSGPEGLAEFGFRPVSYVATRRSNSAVQRRAPGAAADRERSPMVPPEDRGT